MIAVVKVASRMSTVNYCFYNYFDNLYNLDNIKVKKDAGMNKYWLVMGTEKHGTQTQTSIFIHCVKSFKT